MKTIAMVPRVKVSADGDGVVSHAGVGMLRELADLIGLTGHVSAVLADTYRGPWLHDSGRVYTDLAVAVADGADCVAFTSSTESGNQLFTVRPDGSGLRQITHVSGDATNVDWASDGDRITFSIGDETLSRIAVARPDGSGLRILPQPSGVLDDQPSFTPNGWRIHFERFTVATNDDAVWSMSRDGSHQRRILGPFPDGFVTDPNVSPDGRTLSGRGADRPHA